MTWLFNWLKKIYGGVPPGAEDETAEESETPWAMFEIIGFEPNGQIKVRFNWNDAFIEHINGLGFHAETPEDSVQLFFYASQMKPTELSGGDEAVQADETPQLSAPTNRMVS